jgi:hypothetical protein
MEMGKYNRVLICTWIVIKWQSIDYIRVKYICTYLCRYLGENANLFTGVLYNGYGPPGGFSWNSGSQDEPMMVCLNILIHRICNAFQISIICYTNMANKTIPHLRNSSSVTTSSRKICNPIFHYFITIKHVRNCDFISMMHTLCPGFTELLLY